MTSTLEAYNATLRKAWSPNHGETRETTDYIILHATVITSLEEVISRFMNPERQVSAHYVIDTDGTTVQALKNDVVGWHAGRSQWFDDTGLNKSTIGIEIVNEVFLEDGSSPAFPAAQIAALQKLVPLIQKQYNIADHRILAHSDIAPGRKCDPGPVFPWRTVKWGVLHGTNTQPNKQQLQELEKQFNDHFAVLSQEKQSKQLITLLEACGYRFDHALLQKALWAFQCHIHEGKAPRPTKGTPDKPLADDPVAQGYIDAETYAWLVFYAQTSSV